MVARRPRPRTWGYAVAGLMLLGAAVAIGLARQDSASGGGGDVADPDEVLAYAEGVERVAKEVGRVVVVEIKPRLTDLVLGEVAPEQFRAEAERWRRVVVTARRQFAELPVPDELGRAARLFDVALRQYRDAVVAFVAASRRPASELSVAVGEAAQRAEQADRTYDRADALVQAARRDAGLPTRPTLPEE